MNGRVGVILGRLPASGKFFLKAAAACPPGLSRDVSKMSSLGVIGGYCCVVGDVGGGGVLAVVGRREASL